MSNHEDAEDWTRTIPWAVLVVITLPVLVLPLMMAVAFSASFLTTGTEPTRSMMDGAFAVAIVVNHLIVFSLLITILRRQGEGLGDIGWCGELSAPFVLREAGIAILVLALLVVLRFAAFDPLWALARGATPNFTFAFDPGQLEAGTYLRAVTMALGAFIGDSVYRGYAIPRLAGRWGTPGAILVSAVIYGALHITKSGLESVVFATAGGILLGTVFATVSRERLWGLAAGHALYNAVSWTL